VLANEVISLGGKIIGQVDPGNYEFEDSKAIIDGKFIGLPVNEDYESEFTDKRVQNWVEDIKPKFGF